MWFHLYLSALPCLDANIFFYMILFLPDSLLMFTLPWPNIWSQVRDDFAHWAKKYSSLYHIYHTMRESSVVHECWNVVWCPMSIECYRKVLCGMALQWEWQSEKRTNFSSQLSGNIALIIWQNECFTSNYRCTGSENCVHNLYYFNDYHKFCIFLLFSLKMW